MKELHFTVFAIPKGQPRPRFNRASGRTYNPGTADNWKAAVTSSVFAERGQAGKDHYLFEGVPVHVRIEAYFPRPKSHFRTNKSLRESSPFWFTGKPDVDNIAKSTLDALACAGVFRDDAHVASVTITKRYPGTGLPHTRIWVEEIAE
jgi:Holliday junction resolvase RusA-like endonuclease